MPINPSILALLVGVLGTLGHPTVLLAASLQVFAAASLTEALQEIGLAYEQETGQAVRFNFAGSSILARQIEAGAPADLFFSADEAKMDRLETMGFILPETRVSRLSNQLVLVVNREHPAAVMTPRDLTRKSIERIALAEPTTVPAGLYAKAYLKKQNLWTIIAPKVIPTQNVRAALAAVAADNVDAAFVYLSDAAVSARVTVVYEVPRDEGPTIRYPVAVLQESKHLEAAKAFLHYLNSTTAGKVFLRHRFLLLPGPSRASGSGTKRLGVREPCPAFLQPDHHAYGLTRLSP